MARVLGVSPCGYDVWRNRSALAQATSYAVLLRRICAIHAGSHGTYSAPRVHAEWQAEGTTAARKRVAPLMRGVFRRRFPAPLRVAALRVSRITGAMVAPAG